MGKMKRYLLYGACFCLFWSCGRKTVRSSYEIVSRFPVDTTLRCGDTCRIFDRDYGLIGLSSAGDYMIGTLRKRDCFFSLYSVKPELRRVADFGWPGKGAAEMGAPAFFGQWLVENGHTKIWVLDRAKSLFLKIDIDSTLREKRMIVDRAFDMAKAGIPGVRDLFYIDDTLLVGTSDSSVCTAFHYNPVNGTYQSLETAQDFGAGHHPLEYYRISQNLSVVHPTSGRWASVMFFFPQADFRQVDSIGWKTVFIDRVLTPEVCLSEKLRTYYASVCGTAQYVYALWLDQDDEEFGTAERDAEVHVFTWDGRPVARMRVPYTLSITVDAEDRELYALNYYNDSALVVAYELPVLRGMEEVSPAVGMVE